MFFILSVFPHPLFCNFVVVFHFTRHFHPWNLTWISIDPGLTVRDERGGGYPPRRSNGKWDSTETETETETETALISIERRRVEAAAQLGWKKFDLQKKSPSKASMLIGPFQHKENLFFNPILMTLSAALFDCFVSG